MYCRTLHLVGSKEINFRIKSTDLDVSHIYFHNDLDSSYTVLRCEKPRHCGSRGCKTETNLLSFRRKLEY